MFCGCLVLLSERSKLLFYNVDNFNADCNHIYIFIWWPLYAFFTPDFFICQSWYLLYFCQVVLYWYEFFFFVLRLFLFCFQLQIDYFYFSFYFGFSGSFCSVLWFLLEFCFHWFALCVLYLIQFILICFHSYYSFNHSI